MLKYSDMYYIFICVCVANLIFNCHVLLHIIVMIQKGFQSLERKVESAKRSVLYDLNKKMEELRNEIKISNDPQLLESLQERDVLPPLPIKNLADFQDFEIRAEEYCISWKFFGDR